MRYWITVHWPLREDATEDSNSGVWLPDGREAAGAALALGDHVIVYESRSGRPKVLHHSDGNTTYIRCREGREGVVHYGRVTEPLHSLSDSKPEEYSDGSTIWWRWFAPVGIFSRSGFLARSEVALSLGYKPTYNFHGFGTLHSGLIEITQAQYQDIIRKFHDARRLELPSYPIPRGGGATGGGGESTTHRNLKRYVAANPSVALREPGLRTIRLEYPFPTGDRADVVLADAYDRVVAVEVEPSVGDYDIIGPLQAIKYRFMLEWVSDREPGDSRAILVAHAISPNIRELCRRYGVHCVEVPMAEVSGISPV
jgi:hypothetical protein